jgi:branched-chain amino acid transport system permease protein
MRRVIAVHGNFHMLSQTLVNGLLLGGIYGLATIGFSMVWGVMGVINFAHGSYIMIGAYVAYVAFERFGIDPFLSVPIAMAVLFIVGYLVQRLVVNRILKTGLLLSLALTFGLDLIFIDIFVLLFTSDLRSVKTGYTSSAIELGSVLIPNVRLAVCVLALALAWGFHEFLVRARAGQAILATALDRETARLMGINPSKVYALTAGAGAALAGAAGAMSSMLFPISPQLGTGFMGAVFVVTVLGGLGSLGGVILAGFIYGLIQALASAYLGINTQAIVAFAFFLAVLVLRPQGLFGKRFYGENA